MPRRKASDTQSIPVDSTRHKDKRKNIPTRELQEFVKDDEAAPKTLLYPRDPSLDPQLVWKGKDEQDQHPLAVPAVPIYIQEKIQPQALIEDLRKAAQAGQALREVAARPPCGDRRSRLVGTLLHHQPPVRPTEDREDRREGHQPLWG